MRFSVKKHNNVHITETELLLNSIDTSTKMYGLNRRFTRRTFRVTVITS